MNHGRGRIGWFLLGGKGAGAGKTHQSRPPMRGEVGLNMVDGERIDGWEGGGGDGQQSTSRPRCFFRRTRKKDRHVASVAGDGSRVPVPLARCPIGAPMKIEPRRFDEFLGNRQRNGRKKGVRERGIWCLFPIRPYVRLPVF